MNINAEIKIEVENSKQIINALKPDIDKTSRFEVELIPSDKHIILKANAKDISALKAAINSYLRLINSLCEVDKLE